MPKFLEKYLATLQDKDANELWVYLDEDPNAVYEMIELISDSHEIKPVLGG